ncbi:MAG: hypothetical protein HGB02_08485 [Chlorobiaceae bacterium]|nr:hypothetical protein [Chlorobiaceae bacterium]
MNESQIEQIEAGDRERIIRDGRSLSGIDGRPPATKPVKYDSEKHREWVTLSGVHEILKSTEKRALRIAERESKRAEKAEGYMNAVMRALPGRQSQYAYS